MASQVLPDGSEKGLSGYNTERMPRRRIGLAPPAGEIDRNAPYKRIATEEAWTFPALVKAQVDYLERADAPPDPALRMGGMFAANQNLQRSCRTWVSCASPTWTNTALTVSCYCSPRRAYRCCDRATGAHWRARPTTSLPTPAAGTRSASRPVRRSIPGMSRDRSAKSSAR